MSYVNLLIISHERVYLCNVHFREAQRLSEDGLYRKQYLASKQGYYLDAGYMVLDYDCGEHLDKQYAFQNTSNVF